MRPLIPIRQLALAARRSAKKGFLSVGLTIFQTKHQPFGIDLIQDIQRLHPNPSAPKIAIDVGANVGEWTAAWLRCFPNSTVHCFEPFPENFDRLQRRFGDKVFLHRRALSSNAGKRAFYVYEDSVYNSFVPYNDFQKPKGSFELETTTLDAFAKVKDLRSIDVLKIDAEGEDLEILRGADNFIFLIKELHPAFIICECSVNRNSRAKTCLPKFIEYLAQKDYCVASLRVGNVDKKRGLKFVDALFMRKNYDD